MKKARGVLVIVPILAIGLLLAGCGEDLSDERVKQLLASNQCTGPNAFPIANAGFEAGNLSGWTTQDLSAPFDALRAELGGITIGCCGGSLVTAPTEGMWTMVTGFDGNGPGTIRIAQDVTVAECSNAVAFDYHLAWDLMTFCSGCLNRTFTVLIEPPGGGAPLQTSLIFTMVAGTTGDTGPIGGLVDVSAFRTQTVRIAFEWFVSEPSSGPAAFQMDNLRAL